MKRPLDVTRRADGLVKSAPESDATRSLQNAPSKEEVERALARLVDAVLPDSRSGRRDASRRGKRRAP